MNRWRNILLVLVTIAALAASLVLGGRVLCVGPDRHAAVEFRHATCPESSGHDHEDHSDHEKDCVDFELAQDLGDHSGRGVSAVDHSFEWVWVSVPAAEVLVEGGARPGVPPDEGPPVGVWRGVGSVILLI